jgi:hypothetical protein
MSLWSAAATGIGFAAMLAVYRGRQRHGGVKNFVPPAALPKPA